MTFGGNQLDTTSSSQRIKTTAHARQSHPTVAGSDFLDERPDPDPNSVPVPVAVPLFTEGVATAPGMGLEAESTERRAFF